MQPRPKVPCDALPGLSRGSPVHFGAPRLSAWGGPRPRDMSSSSLALDTAWRARPSPHGPVPRANPGPSLPALVLLRDKSPASLNTLI